MTRHVAGLFTQAVRAVKVHKMRTIFCSLSIALGTAAISLIVASVEGAYEKAYEIIDMFGPDSVLILGGSQEQRAIGIRERTLTLRDVELLRSHLEGAYLVVPMTSKRDVTVSFGGSRQQTRIIGSTEQYSSSWTWPIEEGVDFSGSDVKGLRNVCLIGKEIVRTLFPTERPVGKYITVEKISCEVIGVLTERGVSGTGQNLDDRIVMPITTVMRKLLNESKYISAIRVRFEGPPKEIPARIEDLRELLRTFHLIGEGEPDDFRIISPGEITKFLVALTGSLVLFLGITGVVSLIVAGFVIANLFLISVSERRQEIGIRRACGATRRDIVTQFMMEILLVSTVGACSGYVLGLVVSVGVKSAADFPLNFSYRGFLGGMLIAWLIGFSFGLGPARKASELNPIEAIRG